MSYSPGHFHSFQLHCCSCCCLHRDFDSQNQQSWKKGYFKVKEVLSGAEMQTNGWPKVTHRMEQKGRQVIGRKSHRSQRQSLKKKKRQTQIVLIKCLCFNNHNITLPLIVKLLTNFVHCNAVLVIELLQKMSMSLPFDSCTGYFLWTIIIFALQKNFQKWMLIVWSCCSVLPVKQCLVKHLLKLSQ